jgi:hypothetical protein
MQSHNSRNHSSHIPTKVRTEHNRVVPIRRCRQFINIKTVSLLTTLLVARHLSNLTMQTTQSKAILVHPWTELQSLGEIRSVLLPLVRLLRPTCTMRS